MRNPFANTKSRYKGYLSAPVEGIFFFVYPPPTCKYFASNSQITCKKSLPQPSAIIDLCNVGG